VRGSKTVHYYRLGQLLCERLQDVLDTRGLVLFSLDVADYPHATRKVASWVLLGMGRLARQLKGTPRALLLVDEVGALGSAARHLRGLVGRAREAGLAVVLATQGPSDLEAVDRALLSQVLQDTAWQLAFRQGPQLFAINSVTVFQRHQPVVSRNDQRIDFNQRRIRFQECAIQRLKKRDRGLHQFGGQECGQ